MALVCEISFFSSCSHSYFQRHWLVSFQLTLLFFRPWLTVMPSSPYTFAHTFLAFTPTFKLRFLLIFLSSNMHSYETLAILVLALSTALPALSAPVQTPAVLRYDGLSVGAPDSSDDANTTPEHILVDGYSQDLNQRAPGFGSLASGLLDKLETTDSFGKVIGNGLLSGTSSGFGALGAKILLNDTR